MKALIVKAKRQIASEVGDHVTQSRASARIYIALIIEFLLLTTALQDQMYSIKFMCNLNYHFFFFFLQLQLIF